MPLPKSPTPKQNKQIIVGQTPSQVYMAQIRALLAEACEELGVPTLYVPGVVNSPDISLAMFTLALYEKLVDSGIIVRDKAAEKLKESDDAQASEKAKTKTPSNPKGEVSDKSTGVKGRPTAAKKTA